MKNIFFKILILKLFVTWHLVNGVNARVLEKGEMEEYFTRSFLGVSFDKKTGDIHPGYRLAKRYSEELNEKVKSKDFARAVDLRDTLFHIFTTGAHWGFSKKNNTVKGEERECGLAALLVLSAAIDEDSLEKLKKPLPNSEAYLRRHTRFVLDTITANREKLASPKRRDEELIYVEPTFHRFELEHHFNRLQKVNPYAVSRDGVVKDFILNLKRLINVLHDEYLPDNEDLPDSIILDRLATLVSALVEQQLCLPNGFKSSLHTTGNSDDSRRDHYILKAYDATNIKQKKNG